MTLTTINLNDQRTIYLETFGCQMNELDSELVQDQLAALGYVFHEVRATADVVLFNTCSVREQAENKVLSRIGEIGVEKKEGREVVVGILGCLPEREGTILLSKYPQIDFICGPSELDRLPTMLHNAVAGERLSATDRSALQGNRSRRSAALSAVGDNLELLDLARAFNPDHRSTSDKSAYVRITRGCNKFCTYCVVPNTRGAEVHRPPDAIIEECKQLVETGAIEITLLGQTVNHYRYTHGVALNSAGDEVPQIGPSITAFSKPLDENERVTTFAKLLKRVHDEVPKIKRLRFVTSYPKDFGNDILEVMRDCPRICNYLHVPAQSGSNRILKLMNRGYTVEEYLDFIDRARTIIPDVEIAGDIIVGFPTETQDDYEATCDLIRKVRFKNNFVFHYSPRPGTVAIDRFEDDVPRDKKRKWLNEILSIGSKISGDVHKAYEGKTVDVFVERLSPKTTKNSGVELMWENGKVQLSGRTQGDLICVFDVDSEEEANKLIGTVVSVQVTSSAPLLLMGIQCGSNVLN
ncbi:MAG: MiaB/RimO family radical SAM methylthiotransferase [Phycisphaerales bacterium]|jgi:tRNA-2-methylthio-N6-dimethylallyladenosine synthase|nr:MiaB/RimO family radical SAM methylthiotransferase [Phycisphaerales bacterium]